MVGIALGRSSEGLKLATAKKSSSGAISVHKYQLVSHSCNKSPLPPASCPPRIVCKPQAGLSRGSKKSGPPKTCFREKQISAGIHPWNWDWPKRLESPKATSSPLKIGKVLMIAHLWSVELFQSSSVYRFNLILSLSFKNRYPSFVPKYWGLTLLKESFPVKDKWLQVGVLPSWQVYMDSKRKHDIVGYGKIGHCKHFRRWECIARQDMVRQGKVL